VRTKKLWGGRAILLSGAHPRTGFRGDSMSRCQRWLSVGGVLALALGALLLLPDTGRPQQQIQPGVQGQGRSGMPRNVTIIPGIQFGYLGNSSFGGINGGVHGLNGGAWRDRQGPRVNASRRPLARAVSCFTPPPPPRRR